MAALMYSTAQWCRQFNEHVGEGRFSGRVSALGGEVEARSVTWEDLSRFQSASGGVSCWGDEATGWDAATLKPATAPDMATIATTKAKYKHPAVAADADPWASDAGV